MSAIDPFKDKYSLLSSSAPSGKIHARSLSYRNAAQEELLEEERQLKKETASPDIPVALSAHMELADRALNNDRKINSPCSARYHIDKAFLLYSHLEDSDLQDKYLIKLSELGGKHYLKEKETQPLKLELQPPEMIDARLYKKTELSIALSFHMELANRALNKNIKKTSEDVAKYHIEKSWEFYDRLDDPELRQEYRISFSKLYIKLYKKENKSKLSEKTYMQLIEETENDNISAAISAHIELTNRALKNEEEENYQYFAQYHIKKAIDTCHYYVVNPEHQKKYLHQLHLLLIELLNKSENKYDIVDWSLNIYMNYLDKAIDTDSGNTDIYIKQTMQLLVCAGEYEGKQGHVARLEYFVSKNGEQSEVKRIVNSCLQEAYTIISGANNLDELKAAPPYIKQAAQSCEGVDSEVRRADYNKRLSALRLELKQKGDKFASQKSKKTMPPSASTNKMGQFSHKPKEDVGNSERAKPQSLSEFLFGNKK